jgi:hypothetical protein
MSSMPYEEGDDSVYDADDLPGALYEDIRTLVAWMREEDDRFDDIRRAWEDDPELLESVDEVEGALNRLEAWLPKPALR